MGILIYLILTYDWVSLLSKAYLQESCANFPATAIWAEWPATRLNCTCLQKTYSTLHQTQFAGSHMMYGLKMKLSHDQFGDDIETPFFLVLSMEQIRYSFSSVRFCGGFLLGYPSPPLIETSWQEDNCLYLGAKQILVSSHVYECHKLPICHPVLFAKPSFATEILSDTSSSEDEP